MLTCYNKWPPSLIRKANARTTNIPKTPCRPCLVLRASECENLAITILRTTQRDAMRCDFLISIIERANVGSECMISRNISTLGTRCDSIIIISVSKERTSECMILLRVTFAVSLPPQGHATCLASSNVPTSECAFLIPESPCNAFEVARLSFQRKAMRLGYQYHRPGPKTRIFTLINNLPIATVNLYKSCTSAPIFLHHPRRL